MGTPHEPLDSLSQAPHLTPLLSSKGKAEWQTQLESRSGLSASQHTGVRLTGRGPSEAPGKEGVSLCVQSDTNTEATDVSRMKEWAEMEQRMGSWRLPGCWESGTEEKMPFHVGH